MNSRQWHDVKVIQSETGAQELIIENLEHLGDTASLIVTREGLNFKIGIQQDMSPSDVNSQVPSG